MRRVSVEEAGKMGISTCHEQMDNGEFRFRLRASDGSAYIRTVAPDRGAWQNSHSHREVVEVYLVQRGWMALAEADGEEMRLAIYSPGDSVTTHAGVVHNVYLSAASVIHTVKYAQHTDTDWTGDESFDRRTKALTESDIRRLAGQPA